MSRAGSSKKDIVFDCITQITSCLNIFKLRKNVSDFWQRIVLILSIYIYTLILTINRLGFRQNIFF